MSGPRVTPLLMAFCALAIGALAVGPFLYRSLLPAAVDAEPAGCSFVVITAGLFLLVASAAIWQLRRQRRAPPPEMDRRLWEAALGNEEEGPPD